MTADVSWIYAIVAFLALIPSVGYAVRYHWVTRGGWRSHPVGRALMYKAVVNALLLTFVTFNIIYVSIVGRSYEARAYIGTGLFMLFAVVLWKLWIAFEKLQKDDRKKDENLRS